MSCGIVPLAVAFLAGALLGACLMGISIILWAALAASSAADVRPGRRP